MKTVKVVAAIIRANKRILATQRGYGEFAGGWEFPGGKVEPGEQPEQALAREIREELATSVIIDRRVISVVYEYPTFILNMDCFLCELAGGSPQLLEHSAARWLDVDHLYDVEWLPADEGVLRAIKDQGIV